MDVAFGTVWEAVATRLPDATAVCEPGARWTFAEFDDRASRLATALESAGVRAGDTVACYLYNGSAYLETVFAAFKLGAVPVNANYRYTAAELTSLLDDAGAAAIVFSGPLAPNVAHAAAHLSSLRLLVRDGDAPADAPGPDAADLAMIRRATPPRPHAPRPGTDRLFMYTGGTTGRPKGVVWQQVDLLHSIAVAVFGPLGRDVPPADLDDAVELAVSARTGGRSPVTLPVVPLMHGTGLFNTLGALLVGGRAVLTRPGRLDPRHVWETVAAERVGTIVVAGNAVAVPLVDELVRAEGAGSPHDLSSLRVVLSSGTALGDRAKRALHARTALTVTDAIAASEGGPFAFAVTRSVDDLPARFRPVPATRLIADDGRVLAPGEPGTGVLAYRGPLPLGYHGDAERTAATFRFVDGVRYAVPGDLAELTPDGVIRFLGRGAGVINTGGEKVHPQEVEDVLLADPAVADCVVVGVPDPVWGERVTAVVASPGAGPELPGRLRERVCAVLAGYKVPRAVVVVDELPRTPTGKIEIARARELAGAVPSAG
ncbi:acyl-CoA synthetase [Pseudonocardia sp. AL041005-10]|nr:AMP-binding protein [Pseudonocardia sp. AL041005-10]ALE81109.1 acyl-CoA synthetase [Pseudonocardia sp. AL041005-10]